MEIKNFSTTSKNDIKSIAIGGFDGVHYAHQKLIDELYDGCIVIIETGYANITPSFDRVDYIKIPILFFELDDIKDLSGKEFISKLIEIFPKLETIVVGYDFHFGKNRASGAYDLARFFSGAVKIIDEVILDNISVHSKTIREYIKSGDIKSANKLLNHKFKIKGDNKVFLYRFSLLKKIVSSVLFLSVKRINRAKRIEQIWFGLAAGLAMTVSTIITLIARWKYGAFTSSFFLVIG